MEDAKELMKACWVGCFPLGPEPWRMLPVFRCHRWTPRWEYILVAQEWVVLVKQGGLSVLCEREPPQYQ